MLTTRGDLSGSDTVAADADWGYATPGVLSPAAAETPVTPLEWPSDAEVLDIERSAMWRWRRRAAMLATISGIALAVVTFSLGSPITNYALTSANGAPSPAVADSGNATGDSGSLDGSTFTEPASLVDSINLYSSSGNIDSRLNLAGTIDTTTTTAATTTTIGWSEPAIEPESEWTDAGHGVRVPDVLLRIRFCESTNNYKAAHVSSSARGAYQFLSGSWSWYGHAARYGAATADLATPAQQDEAAVVTLNKDGTRPWKASFGCWGSASINSNYATARPPTTTTTTTTASSTTETSSGGTTTSQPSSTTQTTQPTTSSSTSTTAPTTTTSASTTTTVSSTTASTAAGG